MTTAATLRPRSLAAKYWRVLGVAIFVLVAVGASVQSAFEYRHTLQILGRLQRTEARAAATRIEGYIESITTQLQQVARLPWKELGDGARAEEYRRLIALVPPVVDLRYVDREGLERVFVSRVEADRVDAGRRVAAAPEINAARASGRGMGSVRFHEGSEPRVTLAVPEAAGGAVLLADVDLRFAHDVVREIQVGKAGRAYVVDGSGRLVAHPDMMRVLRGEPLPAQRMRDIVAAARPTGAALRSSDFDGRDVVMSSVAIEALGGFVVVEEPSSQALEPLQTIVTRSLLILLGGLVLALAASRVMARSLSAPIVALQAAAERFGRGDLKARIRVETGDDRVTSLPRQP